MKRQIFNFKFFILVLVLMPCVYLVQAQINDKKVCSKKCYVDMYKCLVKGTGLKPKVCYSENVAEMLLCLDSRGFGKLKRKRTCFKQNKSCNQTCK
jgi:hypothetical protein